MGQEVGVSVEQFRSAAPVPHSFLPPLLPSYSFPLLRRGFSTGRTSFRELPVPACVLQRLQSLWGWYHLLFLWWSLIAPAPGVLPFLKHISQKHHALGRRAEPCPVVGPSGAGCIWDGAALGIFSQRPPLQSPRCQNLHLVTGSHQGMPKPDKKHEFNYI